MNGIASSWTSSLGFTSLVGARPLSSPLWVTGAPTSITWLTASLVTWLSRTVSVDFPFSVRTDT